jgi:hypothetical protein
VWDGIAGIVPPPVSDRRFGEPHMAELPCGRIVMMIRSTAVPYGDEHPQNVLWQTYSDDAGATWAQMQPTSLWGFPPHLSMLSGGRLLCSYGYRRPPYGQRACISADGLGWDRAQEIALREDAQSGDLGYPVSLELSGGRILTVYYQSATQWPPARMKPPDPDRARPDILGTIWDLPA